MEKASRMTAPMNVRNSWNELELAWDFPSVIGAWEFLGGRRCR